MAEETAIPVGVSPDTEDAGRLSESNRARLVMALISTVLLSEINPFTYSLAIVITPLVGHSFPAAGNSISWMLTILGVVGGATIALTTKAADLWGKKRIMLASAIVFWVGTVICALTANWAVFLVGRGLEAVSIGMGALCYSLVRDVMPRSWVPITIGFLGTGIGVSGIAAPLIGGLLTQHYSWRSVFWFMVIYMAVAIPLFAIFMPESRVRLRKRLDVLGAVLIGGGLGGVLIYLSEGGSWGWGTPGTYGYLIGGLVLLAAFVWWENKISFPVIELKLLTSSRLAMLIGISFFFTATFTGLTYLSSFMFLVGKKQVEGAVFAAAEAQSHLPLATLQHFISFRGNIDYAPGFDLFQFAWHILLWGSLGAMIVGPLAGAWARRTGARVPLIAGMLIMVITMAALVVWHGNWLQYMVLFIVGNLGAGLYYGTAPNMLVDVVPKQQQAISAGFFAGAGSIGSAFLTAILSSVLARFPFQIVSQQPKGGKMVSVVTNVSQVYTANGYAWAFGICVVTAFIGLILAIVIKAGREPAKGGALE